MVNAAPVMLLPVIEIDAVPVFVSVTPIDALRPTAKFPKPTLDGLALRVPCVPVPLSGIDSVPFVAVDVIVMLPETVPIADGVNVAEKFAVPPAAICCPGLIPLVLKTEFVVLTVLIVIVEVPEFVSVIVCGLLLPTATLAKLTLPGLGVRVLPAATALPVNVSVCGEAAALSWNVMIPVAPAVEVGAN